MIAQADITTAQLAGVFGGMLLAVCGSEAAHAQLDPRTARELAIISRVLEKRLGETRRSIVSAFSPS